MRTCIPIPFAVLAGVLAGVLSASQVLAESESLAIEEVIVTAQKRAQSLQEVPIAVSAFDQRALEEYAFDHIMDVANHVPNLNISTPFAASNPFISLRGIGNGGDFNPNIDSGVAVHIDDVFLQAPAGRLGQMFDLERLEVLRGPQGTLYGKNTTGGAINMISRKPGDEFEANMTFSAGDYDLLSFEGGVSFPIIQDKLAARIAITSNSRDGVAKNLYDGKRVNDIDNQAGRAVVVFTPDDTLTATLTFHMFENSSTQRIGKGQVLLNESFQYERFPDGQIDLTNAVQDFSGFNGFADDPDPYRVNVNNDGYEDVETWGTSLTIVKDWERFSLTSVTGYNDVEREIYIDFDFGPNQLGENGVRDEAEHFSQELRMTYDNQENLSAIGG
ncbi:MAG TPA: TonB-dependent receptor plug domain-containing protein, partial [Pseudomonadales bacterium]